jgi:hypothetical protein
MAGPEWNTTTNYEINGLVYETLLGLHPTTLQYLPVLATHWQVSPDKKTFRFRLDPNARFSDGTAVTSEDVVASWKFQTDKTLQDLYFYTELNKLEPPVAESKYVVRMTAKTLDWKNFQIASGFRVFPAHVLKTLNGAAYLRDYNFKLLPGTGPYIINEADVKGTSISIRRCPDYWAAVSRQHRPVTSRDPADGDPGPEPRVRNLQEGRSRLSLREHFAAVGAGLNTQRSSGALVKRKVFNNYPQGLFLASTRGARRGRHPDPQSVRAPAEPPAADRYTLLSREHPAEFVLPASD